MTPAEAASGGHSAPAAATLLIGCPRCAGPLTVENHTVRHNVEGVGVEAVAILYCPPCGGRWDLFLHLSTSATRTPRESGAQQRARRRLRTQHAR